jgi:integration host factor subunit beta
MTKSELIEEVAKRTKITKSRAEAVVNCVFESMAAALQRGEGIEIRGLGSFTIRQRDAYQGRNPQTGEAVHVPEKRVPWFTVGKELRQLVSGPEVPGIPDDLDDDEDDDEG